MHAQRKMEHLRISLEEDVAFREVTSGLEKYRFIHQALPELDLAEVDMSTTLLGKHLRAPLIISSMTGGTDLAGAINRNLAQAAQEVGVAMGLGSQRAALADPSLVHTYQVRDVAPDILLLANLGAVQLNYGYTVEHCRRAVDMIQADALILHLNPLQECLQPGGNTNFRGLLPRLAEVCRRLPVPVVIKEVGWGISEEVARHLMEAGVSAIDVAGAGGTSWSEVEMHRAEDQVGRQVARAFAGWGIPTAESIRLVRRGAPDLTLIASGGIRTGVEVAKAIALGADATGVATPLLKWAAVSAEATADGLRGILAELRIAMFCIGASSVQALRNTPHLVKCLT